MGPPKCTPEPTFCIFYKVEKLPSKPSTPSRSNNSATEESPSSCDAYAAFFAIRFCYVYFVLCEMSGWSKGSVRFLVDDVSRLFRVVIFYVDDRDGDVVLGFSLEKLFYGR